MESGQGGRGGQKRPKMGGRPLYKPPNWIRLDLCISPFYVHSVLAWKEKLVFEASILIQVLLTKVPKWIPFLEEWMQNLIRADRFSLFSKIKENTAFSLA